MSVICQRFTIEYNKSITNNDLNKICKLLKKRFKLEGLYYDFSSNKITGISFMFYDSEQYKGMRMYFKNTNRNLFDILINGDITNSNKKHTCSTTLTALNGARHWTMDELIIFAEIFDIFGMRCYDYPSIEVLNKR